VYSDAFNFQFNYRNHLVSRFLLNALFLYDLNDYYSKTNRCSLVVTNSKEYQTPKSRDIMHDVVYFLPLLFGAIRHLYNIGLSNDPLVFGT